MRVVALVLVVLLGCDDSPDGGGRVSQVPPEGQPTTVPTPSRALPSGMLPSETPSTEVTPDDTPPEASADVSPAASLTVAASATPPPPGLLGDLSKSETVKITRLEGGADKLIEDKKRLAPLFKAVGLTQKPKESCPSGLVAITLSFKDGFGTRLGTLGLFMDGDKIREDAALRDAAGERCVTITLRDPKAVAAWLDQAR